MSAAARLAGALATQEVEARAPWSTSLVLVAVVVSDLRQCSVLGGAVLGGKIGGLCGSDVGHGGWAAASRYQGVRSVARADNFRRRKRR